MLLLWTGSWGSTNKPPSTKLGCPIGLLHHQSSPILPHTLTTNESSQFISQFYFLNKYTSLNLHDPLHRINHPPLPNQKSQALAPYSFPTSQGPAPLFPTSQGLFCVFNSWIASSPHFLVNSRNSPVTWKVKFHGFWFSVKRWNCWV